MKKILPTLVLLLISLGTLKAQDMNLPYYQIPDPPAEYTAENAIARMVDGLGFRYFWATEGLRDEDLAFKPSAEARTSRETLNHIFGLSNFFLSSLKGVASESKDISKLSFDELRKMTLNNIKEASDLLKSGTKLEDSSIKFSNGNELPFWYNINGPIADALWHVGQVVTFRRSSGNPFNSNVSVLSGKLRN